MTAVPSGVPFVIGLAGMRLQVRQPVVPRFTVAPPTSRRTLALPVRGPAGPAGTAVGAGLVHPQVTPAATWSITHNLGRKPHGVTIYVDGELVDTDVHVDETYVVLTFHEPTAGEAHIL